MQARIPKRLEANVHQDFGMGVANTIMALSPARVPIRLNRKRALDSLFDRIFYGEPVPTSPENALAVR